MHRICSRKVTNYIHKGVVEPSAAENTLHEVFKPWVKRGSNEK